MCIHAGPQENRWWQADGVMVTELGPDAPMVWLTGTSGNCVSIFKPVFMGMELPDIGPEPRERFDPRSLWWKHELLHRRAMADFDHLVPEIRRDFDALEDEFLAEAASARRGTDGEKRDFVDYAFRKAMEATEGLDRAAAPAGRPAVRGPGLPGDVAAAQCRGGDDGHAGRAGSVSSPAEAGSSTSLRYSVRSSDGVLKESVPKRFQPRRALRFTKENQESDTRTISICQANRGKSHGSDGASRIRSLRDFNHEGH